MTDMQILGEFLFLKKSINQMQMRRLLNISSDGPWKKQRKKRGEREQVDRISFFFSKTSANSRRQFFPFECERSENQLTES